MGKRANISEVPLRRITKIIEGVEEIQVHAEGERPAVHSLPRIDEIQSPITRLSYIFI